MFDFDLAEIYGYEVRTLNQQVKRNIARFPEDFMFQLTKKDIDFIKSQFVILPNKALFSDDEGGNRKISLLLYQIILIVNEKENI